MLLTLGAGVTPAALSIPGIDRLRDSIFQGRKRIGVAGIPQRRELGLREALIPARQVLGQRYILDPTRTDLRDYYPGDVVEAARLSGAGVEDAVAHGTFGKRQVYADNVVDKSKFARTIDVEVSDTGHRTLGPRGNAADMIVESEFGQPVEIERTFVFG